MENLNIHIEVNKELYLKDPDSSNLGRRIISNSIEMILELGFEAFTFKKLGERISSPESSIYRYFENKHILLIYLVSWYWNWIEYQLVFSTMNMKSPDRRLLKAIRILVDPPTLNKSNNHMNIEKLNEILVTDSVKAYHTKEVDSNNKKGYFGSYKKVVQRVSDMVMQCNSTYEYPHMLISTVIEGAHQQRYFAIHLPELTDVGGEKDNIPEFYSKLVFLAIK